MPNALRLTVLLLLLAAALISIGVASVTNDVNAASGDARAVFGIFGMPIVIGLKQAGHRRLEFEWGTIVLVILPFLIGQGWAIWQMMKRRPDFT